MTNAVTLPGETIGEWPSDPNLYQHNKPSVTVLNFNVCLIYKQSRKNSNDGCKNSSKVHRSKRFTSKPIIDWSFPEHEHSYILQHLASLGMHTKTLDKHTQWVTVTSSADSPPRVNGILVLEQHRSICKGQSRRNFPPRERGRSTTLQTSLREVDRFLVSAAQLQ